MDSDEIKETHTLSLEEQNMSIMIDSYRREEITKETGYVIQKYKEHKKERLMANSRTSKGKQYGEVER